MASIRQRLFKSIVDAWNKVKNESASPAKLGFAVALGAFVGFSPFYGFQLLIAVALSFVLRLNKIAVLLGVQVSTPPFTPLVVFGAMQLGEMILHHRWLPLSLDMVRHTPVKELIANTLASFAVGSFALGFALSPPIGIAVTQILKRHRARKAGAVATPKLDDATLAALDARTQKLTGWNKRYAYYKVRTDEVYARVLPELRGRAEVLDLGGGLGLLAALVATASPSSKVRLVEWDEKKLADARVVCGELANVALEGGDARQAVLGSPDAVALLDVLHYSPPAEQDAWLARIADAVKPGGVVVIRELDAAGSSAAFLEKLAVLFRWNRGAAVHARPISELAGALEKKGFGVYVSPAGRSLFRANALIVARKNEPT